MTSLQPTRTEQAAAPALAASVSVPERLGYRVKRVLLGPPLVSTQPHEEKLSKKTALEVVECPDRRLIRAVAETALTAVIGERAEVTVLLPRRTFKRVSQRILHDRQAFDSTGGMRLLLFGRTRIPGIEPGSMLRVTGAVGEYKGHLALANPRYELLPSDAEAR